MSKNKQSEGKQKYRFRQCLKTGRVTCIKGVWPPLLEAQQQHHRKSTYKEKYVTVGFPSSPDLCPKCKGKGIVYSQLTKKLLGICFWCDGKGNINDADIVNAQRRIQTGRGIDNKTSY